MSNAHRKEIASSIFGRKFSAVVQYNAIGAGGLGFDSPAGQIGHGVANVATFLRSCVALVLSHGMGPATRYPLRRNTASIMILFKVISAVAAFLVVSSLRLFKRR